MEVYDELEKALKEIERLTELCNKYEEEHKTTFETWQKDIKENEILHSIIKEVRDYNRKLTKLYDIGTMERSNAETNLCILEDKETLDKLKELKNCIKESQNDAIKNNDDAIKGK